MNSLSSCTGCDERTSRRRFLIASPWLPAPAASTLRCALRRWSGCLQQLFIRLRPVGKDTQLGCWVSAPYMYTESISAGPWLHQKSQDCETHTLNKIYCIKDNTRAMLGGMGRHGQLVTIKVEAAQPTWRGARTI